MSSTNSTMKHQWDEEFEQTQAMVFKLIRIGDTAAERLRELLSTLKDDMLKWIFNATEPKVNGANALINASREGHSKIVEVLLEKGADPHATGTVAFDGEIITRVPPLWAAAAAGHLDVCKLLVKHNVNVNQTTNTNSTPLRGACYDGHLEIVKYLVEKGADIEIANRHGHTALMIASYREKVDVVRYLLSVSAKINRTSVKGNTVLHDAAEAGNLEILNMLIDAGAKMKPDEYGVTPLLSAALCGHMELMPLLFKYANKREKHDAWKLLGATLVDKRLDLGSAIACWKSAFDPDIWDDECQPADFIKELNEVQKRIYAGFKETKSLQEVYDLIGDPDAIRMQALIIRERILGDAHPDTHHYLRLRGAYYLDIGTWSRTWELWSYILQLEQFHHHPMSLATGSTFCAFYDALNIMIEELMMRPDRRQLNRNFNPTIEQVVVILDRAVYEAERYFFSDEESRKENLWAFDERSIQQELENLLGLCLQFVHLISRVNLINVSQPDSTPKTNAPLRSIMAPLIPSRSSNMGRSDGPSSGPSIAFRANPAAQNACTASPPSPPSFFRGVVSNKNQHNSSPMKPSYIITNNVPRLCKCAYLPKQLETYPKIEFDGLQPRCSHLKCLAHRMLAVFTKLHLSPLHMACEEREAREEVEPAPRVTSYFVIEKLLSVGANPAKADENNNTPLHILLANSLEKYALVKLILDWGAPLHSRNGNNETCFEIIQKKPNLMKTIRIGRHISLKQIAANVVKRNELTTETLPAELKNMLAIF